MFPFAFNLILARSWRVVAMHIRTILNFLRITYIVTYNVVNPFTTTNKMKHVALLPMIRWPVAWTRRKFKLSLNISEWNLPRADTIERISGLGGFLNARTFPRMTNKDHFFSLFLSFFSFFLFSLLFFFFLPSVWNKFTAGGTSVETAGESWICERDGGRRRGVAVEKAERRARTKSSFAPAGQSLSLSLPLSLSFFFLSAVWGLRFLPARCSKIA